MNILYVGKIKKRLTHGFIRGIEQKVIFNITVLTVYNMIRLSFEISRNQIL